jgi:WD40 repeat protein
VVLRGHTHRVLIATFSPDGRRVFTIAADQTVRVWNVDGSGEPYVLGLGEGQSAFFAAVSPDGSRVVTGVLDKIGRVWPLGAPFPGNDDPRLWRATSYCLSAPRRAALLSISEDRAHADQEACEHRVAAAAGSTGRD